MKNQRSYINNVLAVILLWVFSLTIAPWGVLHNHDKAPDIPEKHCTHQVHVKNNPETCLICTTHFEKNYTITSQVFDLFLPSRKLIKPHLTFSAAYVTLISTSLRGPPAQV